MSLAKSFRALPMTVTDSLMVLEESLLCSTAFQSYASLPLSGILMPAWWRAKALARTSSSLSWLAR